ncbi:pullulanase [Anaerobacillus alkaliphilus]|uniref:pullulanase n=1 Tax=Anaerobacillus alkaliphilus TaxID=1548597 RepID=A0A4Q0VUT5_9BACI|nr:pullulanase [Anaerobacillus alkaliphilus]RXJ01687.1 pullulanase [Anaerobacillus alkaliphilus]
MINKKYQKVLSFWLSLIMVFSVFTSYIPAVAAAGTTGSVTRHIHLVYDRPDAEYEGWNIWVWGTGAKNDQIDFTEFKDGKAIAKIEVGPNADRVGFVLRSTDNWDTAKKDVEPDRFINLLKNDLVTKVYLTSGEIPFHTVAEVTAPVIEEGNASFFFRDKGLYNNFEMDKIAKVELSIADSLYEMTYDAKNERFVYTYENLAPGTYEYTYLVTVDGATKEVSDPYNTVNGKSTLSYIVADIEVAGTVTPQAVNYNQNAVVTVDLDNKDDIEIRELYVDATEVGGPKKLKVDPELNEVTLNIDHKTTAGQKKLPIVAVDAFGGTHKGEVTLEVKARTFIGEADFDWDEALIYFLLTDRFFDGDSSNNDPYGMNYDTKLPGAYQGGDFKGITEKLDYLKDLGINTIWINPIVENIKYDVRHSTTPYITPYYGYHGYWASDFEKLNPHFGSMADFHELIDEAHARGMKLMIDVVLNHTGYGLKMVDGELAVDKRPPGYPTDAEREKFRDMLRQGKDVGSATVRGELASLPDLITEDPAVRNQIVQWQVDWINKSRTAKGNTIDYFRVDTVKHVEDTTWMAFKNELTKVMPEFKMIGESWGASQNDDHGYLNSGMMDSLLDFDFKNYARNFANGQLDQVHNTLVARNNKLTNSATLGQFLGSHDENGFLSSVGGDKGKLKIASALQITAKGQPVIYYGEELGLSGEANYPYYTNRPNMPWDKIAGNDVLSHYQELLTFRGANSEIFAKGDRVKLAGSDKEKYQLFSRNYNGESVYVGLNVAEQAKEVTVAVSSSDVVVTDHYSGNTFNAENGEVTFTIPAMAAGGTVLLTAEGGTILGTQSTLRVHYQRTDNDYANLGLWLWGDVVTTSQEWPKGTPFGSELTSYGVYADIAIKPNAKDFGLIVLDVTNGDKDGGNKEFELPAGTTDIWLKQGSDEVFFKNPDQEAGIPEDTLRVHYQRTDNNFSNLGLWTWFDVAQPSSNWPSGGTPFVAGQTTDYGAYVDIPLNTGAQKVGFLVLNVTNGDKDGGDKVVELFSSEINEVWIKQGSDEVFYWEPVELPENTVRIHYDRTDKNYDGWAVWNWGDVVAPSEGWPNGATDKAGVGKFGAYYDISLNEAAQEIKFLFVNKIGGAQTRDYKFELLAQYKEIFMKDGDDKVYTNPFGAVPIALISGELLSDKKISLVFSKTEGLDVDALKEEMTIVDKDGSAVTFDNITIEDDKRVTIHGEFDLDQAPFAITYGERTVSAKAGWRLIDEMYGYDGELGAKLHADGTATLKLWSPKADSVSVVLYDKDDQYTVVKENIPMTLGDRGVWSVTLDKENTGIDRLKGFFYHFSITHGDETKLALDPYAKSMAAWNSADANDAYPYGKAAIIDLSEIGPKLDFANIPGYEKREDAIIYEIHVRDFTSDPNIADDLKAQFGTFASFIEKLDYIEEMGVTHVQLLPVMSYFFSDEFNNGERMLEYASTNTNYNWGYDPHSYFSLSGMYSENPNDPELRVKEFKNLINEIHSRGMGVILDVVYNHTARVGIFEDLVPNYYHFMDADGTSRTSFGGGRLGTTHKMARRILVDSILHWVNEYKVDGFRFDMMGDHDAESIQIAFDKAKAINPNIVMIGEGWRTFAGDEGDPVQAADQDWMQYTEAVGSFSDEFRNELKSGFGSEGQPRFITDGARNVQQIFDNIKAQPHNFVADQPGDVVPYIEAHDNLTVYDVIAQSIKKDPAIPANDLEIHKRIRIGNAMVLTAQGTAFIHAGQEFGRTKQWLAPAETEPYKSTYMVDQDGNPFENPYFIHDSYDSSDIINRIDWEKATNAEKYPINNVTREYTQGLIELRRSTDAFRLGSKQLVDQNVTLIKAPEVKTNDKVIAYRNQATNGDAYYVFVNADMTSRTFTIGKDLSGGIVLVDNDEAGIVEVKERTGFTLTGEKITVDALTTVVIKQAAPVKPSPVTPVPTPRPGDQVIVNNPQADKGKIAVPVAQGTKQVLLPANAAVIDGKNSLQVTNEKLTADVPGAVLKQLQELAKGKENANIAFSFNKVEDATVATLTNAAATKAKAKVKAAGEVYDFTLAIVDKDGKVTKLTSFSEPITISLAVSETANKKLIGVYNIKDDGTLVYVGGKVKDGKITAELSHFSKYAVLEFDKEFKDVKSGYWAHDVIKEMSAKHIVQGIDAENFAPTRNVTRAEFAALIVRALGIEASSNDVTFKDIASTKWYASAVAAASQAGIVNGKSATRFAPEETISREEMATMIVRAYEYAQSQQLAEVNDATFTDLSNASSWSKDYINQAAHLGLVNGRANNRFAPLGFTQRAESVQVIANLLNLLN